MAQRRGSVWTGCGTVFLKEFADHLGSGRMRVLEWLVLLTGIFVSKPPHEALPTGASVSALSPASTSHVATVVAPFQLA